MIWEWKRIQKPRRTLSGFLQIFMELCGSKVKLSPRTEISSIGVTNPEIAYMLLLFKILSIDWFLFLFFLKKTLTLTENLLNFNRTYMDRKQPFESSLKMDALCRLFFGGWCVFTNLNFICTKFFLAVVTITGSFRGKYQNLYLSNRTELC